MEEPQIDFYIEITPINSIELITIQKTVDINSKIADSIRNNFFPLTQAQNTSNVSKYFNLIFPKNTSNDNLVNSKTFAKAFCQKTPLNKKLIQLSITYFLSNSLINDDTFILSSDNIIHLGKILTYAYYKKFAKTKIKTSDMLHHGIKAVKKAKTSVLKKHSDSVAILKLFKSFRKVKENMELPPPEMIFLINFLKSVTKLEFRLEKIDKTTFDCYIMVILNFEFLFSAIEGIDIVISHDKLLKALYYRFSKDLNSIEYKCDKHIKKTNFSYLMLFNERINFDENYAIARKEGDMKRNNCDSGVSKLSTFISSGSCNESDYVRIENGIEEGLGVGGEGGKYMEILKQYLMCFQYLIVSSQVISQCGKAKKFSLFFSDTFKQEISKAIHQAYQTSLAAFDFFEYISILSQLKELVIEFNSLDYGSFDTINKFIINNLELQKLSLSLFLSEPHYVPVGLFRQLMSNNNSWINLFKRKRAVLTADVTDDNVDDIITRHLLQTYSDSLSFLFWIIKKKKELKELIIMIITPCILLNNEVFSIILLKFVLNLLLLLNEGDSFLKKTKVVAPFLRIDTRNAPQIKDFFDLINLNQADLYLKHFVFQAQLYEVENIGNLLCRNLTYLSIGDLDIKSFEGFSTAISSFDFQLKSQLKRLAIGLLPIVSCYGSVKQGLLNIIHLKIKSLERVEIRSNLIVSVNEFTDLLNNVHYCFVKELIFELDSKSEDIKKSNKSSYYYYNVSRLMKLMNGFNQKFNEAQNVFQLLLQLLFRKYKGSLVICYK